MKYNAAIRRLFFLLFFLPIFPLTVSAHVDRYYAEGRGLGLTSTFEYWCYEGWYRDAGVQQLTYVNEVYGLVSLRYDYEGGVIFQPGAKLSVTVEAEGYDAAGVSLGAAQQYVLEVDPGTGKIRDAVKIAGAHAIRAKVVNRQYFGGLTTVPENVHLELEVVVDRVYDGGLTTHLLGGSGERGITIWTCSYRDRGSHWGSLRGVVRRERSGMIWNGWYWTHRAGYLCKTAAMQILVKRAGYK